MRRDDASLMCEAGAHRRTLAQEQVRLGTFKKVGSQERRSAPRLARTRRHGRSSGQSLVEFALIAPLFLTLLFGVVEFTLINASVASFNFAAKDGARVGAILGKSAASVNGTQVATDTYIVKDVILPRVVGVVMAKATKIEIFNSTQSGTCVIDSSSKGCQEDVWQPSGSTWASTSDNWPTSARVDALANADYLGVKISYSYTYLTALFAITSPTINLTAESIQRIEPQEYGDRSAPSIAVLASTIAPTWIALRNLQFNLADLLLPTTEYRAFYRFGGRA